MQRLKKLSKDFIHKLTDFSGGALDSDKFEKIIQLVESEIKLHYFTSSSESNLLRIIENQFDRIFFLKECIKYPHHIEVLVNIATNSNYLSDILVRNPEYFFIITNPDKLRNPLSDKDYEKLIYETVNRFKTFEGKVNALRNLKRREFLRIGVTDIYVNEKLERVTYELSLLAKAITSALFYLCYQEILAKYKIEKLSNKYCLIALGKLGGGELNYSSDIDLIAFTDKNTFIKKKIYFNQILTETVQLFIEQASSITPKGFLYRVDFRLRPDGRNAPLCASFNQYLHYYEMRGENWERQMLIKSSFICGSCSLYKKFFSFVEKFTYPSSFRVSPLLQIKKLKANIEKSVSVETDIKTLPGGIRDIEFSVQALQLLNGGRIPHIRTGNTLNAIKFLQECNLLSDNESISFTEAYIFYRKVEHYLQLMNNAQTHTIPESGELLYKLGSYFGFNTIDKFQNTVEVHRKKVSEIYKSITGEADDTTITFLTDINFTDKKRAHNNFEFLQYGKGILAAKKFDALTISSFEIISAALINYLKNSSAPDQVLDNFARIIKTAQFPGIWYKEFADFNYFQLFLRTCEYSQYTINLFAEDKYLRDLFLSRKCFKKIDKTSIPDFSTKEFLFTLSIQYTTGLINTEFVNSYLSGFILNKIKGISDTFSTNKKWQNDFLIIGMGSFGAKELTFTSDIDLIFVVNGLNNYPQIQNEFQELLSEIKNVLSPFEVDCRLRPEGKSSYLVWDQHTYSEYLKSRARVWELQAFLKASYVNGNINQYNSLTKGFISRLKSLDQFFVKKEMMEMRKKLSASGRISSAADIKKSTGGLTDIEFIVSYMLLTNYHYVKKCIGAGTQKSVNILSLDKQIKINLDKMAEYFRTLKNIELANKILFDTRTSRIPADEIKLKKLSLFLDYKDHKSFLNELNNVLVKNAKFYFEVFNN